MRLPVPTGNQRGFTLLEVLVALVVLSIGVLGFMAVQYQSIGSRAFAKNMDTAMTAGITSLEELQTVDFAQMSGTGTEYMDRKTGEPATETEFQAGTAYKIEWQVSGWDAVTANPNSFLREVKTVTAVITWQGKGFQNSALLFSFDRGRKKGDIS